MRADLHVHTYFSDGELSPEKAVAEAKCNGVELLSVTDHDTAAGCGEVKKLCTMQGIKSVDGIEISAYKDKVKIHVLCYAWDKDNADFSRFMDGLYKGSIARAENIIFKLNRIGIKLTYEDAVAERHSAATPIHSMHIARAAVKKGYAENPFAFYKKYLMIDCPAFSDLNRPTPEQTAEIISAAGGVSSLAHPGRIEMPAAEIKKLTKRMKECGLCGIEAVYSSHTAKETAYYKELAGELGLLVTGGSDTHYIHGNRRIGTPCFEPSEALLQKLKI